MYSIFFDVSNKTYRLPTNPEEISISESMAIEKVSVLALGEVAIPSHKEINVYNFEVELPYSERSYTVTNGDFKNGDYYLNLFRQWRNDKIPIRFIASNGITEDINSMVFIKDLSITEKVGEEGDKYVEFTLWEYRDYGKRTIKQIKTVSNKSVKQKVLTASVNPKTNGTHIVQSGDTLWGIAKKYYGNGSQYVKIYNANKDKIKNPSVIKPGWKLVIP